MLAKIYWFLFCSNVILSSAQFLALPEKKTLHLCCHLTVRTLQVIDILSLFQLLILKVERGSSSMERESTELCNYIDISQAAVVIL